MELLPDVTNYWKEILLFSLLWFCLIVLVTRYKWLKDEASNIKIITEILAIIVGGIWVYEIFIYNEIIKPALQPAQVNITNRAELVGQKNNLKIVQFHSILKNSSKVKLYVLTYWMDIYGVSIQPIASTSSDEFMSAAVKTLNSTDSLYKKSAVKDHSRSVQPELIQIEPLIDEGWWLEPGEEVSVSRILFVPDRYQVAQITSRSRTIKSENQVCIHWELSQDKNTGEKKINPASYFNNNIDNKCKDIDVADLLKFDAAQDEHIALRDKYGLSTMLSKVEILLQESESL